MTVTIYALSAFSQSLVLSQNLYLFVLSDREFERGSHFRSYLFWFVIAVVLLLGIIMLTKIDIGQWQPSQGFEHNRQIVERVYEYCTQLFNQDENPMCAGMAKIAGGEVLRGLEEIQRQWQPSQGFEHNRQIVEHFYEYCTQLFNQDENPMCAGMAKIAGGEVLRGLEEIQRQIDAN